MGNKNTLDIDSFHVSSDEAYSPGVYKIEDKDSVYIGSTTRKLSQRFLQHYHNDSGTHTKTYNMLHSGGAFTCIQSFEKDEYLTEQDIRDAEARYIRMFKRGSHKKLLNDKLPVNTSQETNFHYNVLRIPDEFYNEIVEEIERSGFLVLDGRVYNKKFEILDEIDGLCELYGYDLLYDEFFNEHNNSEDARAFDNCNVKRIDCKDGYVYVVIAYNGKEAEICINEHLFSFLEFQYYEPHNVITAMERTIPNTIQVTLNKERLELSDKDMTDWVCNAYDYLKEI